MSCNKNAKNTRCDNNTSEHIPASGCTPFNECIGLGRSLVYDGKCFSVSKSRTVADGWYGEVKVQNGCIVDVRGSTVFEYTPPPCTSNPLPCGGGSTWSVNISNTVGNNISNYPDGIYGHTYIQGSGDIQVTGDGTANLPYIIKYTSSSINKTHVLASGVLSISGSGDQLQPYEIKHNESTLGGGTFGSFTVDSYGHIVGYNDVSDGDGILSVVGGPGVKVELLHGIATVSLEDSKVEHGEYKFGGYSVGINSRGIISNISRDINITAGDYTLGDKVVSVNELGSITSIVDTPQLPRNHYVASFDGSRQSMSVDIVTTQLGNFKITYRGYLGDITGTNNKKGPIQYQGNIVFQIDNRSFVPYVILSNNHIIEAFIYTDTTYQPGKHNITISASPDNPIEETGFIEVELIQRL